MYQHALRSSSYDAVLTRTRKQLSDAMANCSRPVVTTKFNPYSGVLLHLISTLSSGVPVVWVDTGYNTRDTYAFSQYLQALLSLNLQTYQPVDHAYRTPPGIDSAEHAEFVRQVKLEPFSRAIGSLDPDVWFSSLRSSQTAHRRHLPASEAISHSLTKVYPLLAWSDGMMQEYLKRNAIAKGPECYDPTKGEAKRECGLHTQRWTDSAHPPDSAC